MSVFGLGPSLCSQAAHQELGLSCWQRCLPVVMTWGAGSRSALLQGHGAVGLGPTFGSGGWRPRDLPPAWQAMGLWGHATRAGAGRMLDQGLCCFCRSKQGGSPGAYDRSFRWKYHQFRFLCHVSRAAAGPGSMGMTPRASTGEESCCACLHKTSCLCLAHSQMRCPAT